MAATDGATVHEGGSAGGEPPHHRTAADAGDAGEDTAEGAAGMNKSVIRKPCDLLKIHTF